MILLEIFTLLPQTPFSVPLLFPSTLAVPTPKTPSSSTALISLRAPEDVGAFLSATHDECGDSTFYNGIRDGITPTASVDCLVLCKNILPYGMWHLEALAPRAHQIVQYGTCGFSVQIQRYTDALQYYLGNYGIRGLIPSSVEKYGIKQDGTVAAYGIMNCHETLGRDPEILWQIDKLGGSKLPTYANDQTLSWQDWWEAVGWGKEQGEPELKVPKTEVRGPESEIELAMVHLYEMLQDTQCLCAVSFPSSNSCLL
jgi:hypothetical protein